ncbi:MAG: hypothetical protein JXX28_14665 [Deltaproteobacteria bacterium]|nr:hypothetical protein [Deltaproteobacteria bacterium]
MTLPHHSDQRIAYASGLREGAPMITRPATLLFLSALIAGCSNDSHWTALDNDRDGTVNEFDCDDANPEIHPGAEEVCNDIDDDCNGIIDDDLRGPWYEDRDGDGWGDDDHRVEGCAPDDSYVLKGGDCDDTDADVFPAAPELCNALDDDCDGAVDEGVTAAWYADGDGDGFGDPATAEQACTAPTGFVVDGTDCDDGDPARSPAAQEICNGVDDDCDGAVDDGFPAEAWFEDADQDGYGGAVIVVSCQQPEGYVALPGDCDDTTRLAYPGLAEVCDGLDNDCDGRADDGIPGVWYSDGDGDGYGLSSTMTLGCPPDPTYVADDGDCDDTNDAVYPGGAEVCDGLDNDCDHDTDEGVLPTWYRDADGDTYGDLETSQPACAQPAGWVSNPDDCDDAHADANPAGTEVCDGLDNDCDTRVDEGFPTVSWYQDDDGDGFGTGVTVADCAPPAGYSAGTGDCDDDDSAIHPGALERCNSKDDDCDGEADEGLPTRWYLDADGDGYGLADATLDGCPTTSSYVALSGDCDDAHASAHPGGTEVCDELDNDCNGSVDDGVTTTYYPDADGDTYGNGALPRAACAPPAGYVTDHRDCDDSTVLVSPSGSEVCNGVDDNCDTVIDEGFPATTWYRDADGDTYGIDSVQLVACYKPSGYSANHPDCNDSNPSVHPDALETCNEIDDDCDTLVDEGMTSPFYRDRDDDGYGVTADVVQACSAPAGYSATPGDCNDGNLDENILLADSIHPGAAQVCDNIDHDCDRQVDFDSDGDGWSDEACGGDDCDDGNYFVSGAQDGGCSWGTSCFDILTSGLSTGDGDYTISPDGSGAEGEVVRCDMTTAGGGWTRIGLIDPMGVEDPARMGDCPDELSFDFTTGTCVGDGYSREAYVRTQGIAYSEARVHAELYAIGRPDAFSDAYDGYRTWVSFTNPYVDGISITSGAPVVDQSKSHIWTYGLMSENSPYVDEGCPTGFYSLEVLRNFSCIPDAPSDYYAPSGPHFGSEWNYRSWPEFRTQSIWVRILHDENPWSDYYGNGDENIGIGLLEVYVREHAP